MQTCYYSKVSSDFKNGLVVAENAKHPSVGSVEENEKIYNHDTNNQSISLLRRKNTWVDPTWHEKGPYLISNFLVYVQDQTNKQTLLPYRATVKIIHLQYISLTLDWLSKRLL